MAIDIVGVNRSYPAGADLSALQYTFVKMSGTTVIAPTAATDKVVGVLLNKPTSGRAATVAITGVVKVVASKAIAAGVPIYITASGQATDTQAANVAVGISETASSGAGTIVSVLLKPLAAVA